MSFLSDHGLRTFWAKIKSTFGASIGANTTDSSVSISLYNKADTPTALGDVATIGAATSSKAGVMSAEDKSKLSGIAPGATANLGTVTQVSVGSGLTGGPITDSGTISHASGTGYNHIPSGGSSGKILIWSGDGTATWGDATGEYTLPTASSTVKGGIKIGNNLTMNGEVLNAVDTTYVFNTAYNASTNKAATMSDIETALTGAAKYSGTLSSEEAFIALTNYKQGQYWVVSESFSHTLGDAKTITLDAGNMVFCRTSYTSAYSPSHFDIIQADIESIPDSVIEALN